jgi:iron complex outermembrane receptor protein
MTHTLKTTAAFTALATAMAAPVAAQDTPPTQQDDIRIEERVVITMPGPSREADELIGNAAVINRDEILDRLEPSLGDTLAKQPGIASTYFGPAASRPVVRGLGAERVLVLTNSLGVIDASAASPDHQVTGDGIDATRIEILRGPAALAYGGQAIGGVVNVIDGLIAETVPDAPTADGLAAYTSVNEGTQLAARGQAPVGSVVFTASASQRDAEELSIPGFSESNALRAEEGFPDEEQGTLENSYLETDALAGGVSWVGDAGFIGVSVRQSNALYGLPGAHGHEEEEEEEEGHDEEEHEEEEEAPFIDLSQTRYDIRGGLHFHGQTIDRVSAAVSIVDYDHTEFEGPGEPGTVFETTGHEARIEATHNPIMGLEGTVGLQHSFKKLGAAGDEAFITPTKTERLGVFLYEVLKLDNDIGIEGGLRFDNSRLDNAIQGERSFDALSGSIGVHRHINDTLFLGGQISYTERAPSDTELFANGPHLATSQFEIGDSTLDIESGLNFEGVIRADFDNASIGLNAFVTRFDNFIYLAPRGDEEDELPVFVFTADDADFQGFELYGNYETSGWMNALWTMTASLDLVNAELGNGENVPYVPPVTVQLGADAEWTRWSVGASATLAADQDDPGAGILPTDGYTLVDLRASYNLGGLDPRLGNSKLFVEARNIGDTEARAATSVLKDVAPLPGQNIRAGIRVSF